MAALGGVGRGRGRRGRGVAVREGEGDCCKLGVGNSLSIYISLVILHVYCGNGRNGASLPVFLCILVKPLKSDAY